MDAVMCPVCASTDVKEAVGVWLECGECALIFRPFTQQEMDVLDAPVWVGVDPSPFEPLSEDVESDV